jgi:hypothetical protein
MLHRGRINALGLRKSFVLRETVRQIAYTRSSHRTKVFHLYQAVLYSLSVGEVAGIETEII